MLLLRHKRLLLLAGFAAGVFAAAFLIRSTTHASAQATNFQTGRLSSASIYSVAAATSQGAQSLSSSLQPQTLAASLSVRQILPQLEQKISDWREFQPQKMTIAPYADQTLEFEMTSVRQENGRTIWRGRNALSGAFLVTVATQNEWHAVLEIPAASNFEFHISGQSATVAEKAAAVLCGSDRLTSSAAVASATAGATSSGGGSAKDSSSEDVNAVDVLFFYDSAVFSANSNNTQLLETKIISAVEAANLVLQNSGVDNLRWHYVAAYQVPDYTATDKLQDDLNLMSNTDNAVGQFVADKCALHGVDQAVLYVNSRRKDNYDGLAWVPNSQGSVAHNSALVWNSGYVVLAHEMAHNFGCHHDRATEGAADGDGKYSYGFSFKLNGADTGTVMSYAPTRVPFFSNPDRSYSGIRLGVPENQFKEANNSRVLWENAALMADSRTAAQVPIITAQPQSATVRHGAGFTLSVSAAGEGLTFQWRKNGVDLVGATDAVYSKSSAGVGDEGVYNVVVANSVGKASSASASVAVADTASASTPMASTTGNSGGGGGGAVEPWVLAALAAVGSLRLIGRARRGR